MSELAKSFEPAAIEARWAPLWEQSGVYEPTLDPAKPSFSIQLPPPNVTGTLHMGHAFNQTIMDSLTRYHRMRGDNTLWVPGTDHAGIATQIVVERQLQAQGHVAPGPRPRELRRTRVGVEAGVRLHHHAPDAPPGRLGRLEARVLHDGRRAVEDGHRDLRAPVRRGPDLSRQAPRELGSGAASRPCPTSRWTARRKTASCGTSAIRWPTARAT